MYSPTLGLINIAAYVRQHILPRYFRKSSQDPSRRFTKSISDLFLTAVFTLCVWCSSTEDCARLILGLTRRGRVHLCIFVFLCEVGHDAIFIIFMT